MPKATSAHAGMTADRRTTSLQTWLAIVILSMGCFTFVSSEMLPIGLLGPIADTVDLSLGITGLLVTGFAVVVALTAAPLTVLTGRTDRKRLMLGLLIACAAGNALAAVAETFAVLLIARLIVALAIGVFWSIATAMAIRLVPAEMAVRATSVVLGGLAVAAVLGVPLGTLIGQNAGWHAAFAALSGLSIVLCAAAVLLLPSMPATSTGSLTALSHAFQSGELRMVFWVTALVMTGNFLAYTYVTPYLQRVVSLPESWMSPLLFVYGIAGVIGNFAVGGAIARSLRAALIGSLALLTLSLLLLWAADDSRVFSIILLATWGIAYASLPVVLQTWVFKAAEATGDSEAALSLFVVAFNGAIAAGALLGGLVLDHLGARPLVLIAGLVVLMGLLAFSASRYNKAH